MGADLFSMPGFFLMLVQGAAGGIVAGVAFWATVRVEIRWLRRDVDFLLRVHDNRKRGDKL